MRKIILINVAYALLISLFFYASCKKINHSLYPTPSNYRMQGYTKISYNSGATVNENYSFFYDASGRVSQILFTANDSNLASTGSAATSSTFDYFSDTVIKTTTEIKAAQVLEIDTFVTNAQGLIVNAWFTNYVYSFQYYGKLLANEYETYRGDSSTSISADVMSYTSSNGDLLLRSFDGTLTAGFCDTGRNSTINPPDVTLFTPLTVTWTSFATATPTVYTHNGVNGYSDQLTGYTGGGPLQVQAVDGFGTISRDICIYPQDLWTTQSYVMYPGYANRPGDYLQLLAFTTYGTNIYNDNHLLKAIYNPGDTTLVTYTIDADSKITQTSVSYKDTHNNVTSAVYKIQYETY